MTTIGERIKLVRGETTRDIYAPKIGVSKNTLASYETENSVPNHTVLTNILGLHPEISPAWLLTGEGKMLKNGAENVQSLARAQALESERPQAITIDEAGWPQIPRWQNPDPGIFDYIPMAKATLSAGGGSFVLTEEIEGYYAFRNSWLNAIASSKRNLILMRITGDSMFPTLQTGDTVMIDTGRRCIKEGEIYALRVEDTIIIKRLSYRIGGKVLIISDNRKEFDPYEAQPQDIHILGQIIFFSRVLIPD